MKKRCINGEICVTGILAIIIFFINIRHIAILDGPFMFNDELGYLGNAAALAGKDWHEVMQYCSWYGFGWSIVISPLFRIFSNMQIIYRCINVLNALLVVAVYLMHRHILQKMFKDMVPSVITGIAACTCFYPSILVNSSIAWSETWLLFIFTVTTVFLYHMIQKPRTYKVFVWGVLLYYLYVCHNRMIAIILAGILILAALVFTGIVKKRDVLLFLAAIVISNVLFGDLKEYIVELNWRLGLPSGNDLGSNLIRLANLFTLAGIKYFISVLFSQFLYICVSSWGMVPLGIYACVNKIIQTTRQHKPGEGLLAGWLVLSFFSAFAVSAIFMGGNTDISNARLDHIFYGRYFEPTITLLLSYGFLYLVTVNRESHHFAIYKTGYMSAVGVCALVASVVVGKLNTLVFNRPNASGIAAFVERFPDPVFAAALFSIIGTAILFELFSHMKVYKYIAMCAFAAACLFNVHSAEKSIVLSQENHIREIPFVKAISTYDLADLPVYVSCNGNYKSYFQCMLVDIPLKYTQDLTLDTVPDEKCYFVISSSAYASQGFDIHNEVIAHSKDTLFIYVDKGMKDDDRQVPIFLDQMYLKDPSVLGSDRIHVEAANETLAFYGPYIRLNTGNYELNVQLNIESAEELESYGVFQIYSSSQKTVFAEGEITRKLVNEGTVQICVPFSLSEDINDMEIYLRTKPGTSYDIYSFMLEKAYVFDYELNSDGLMFAVDGFSYAETMGRWMNENESSVSCYLPSDNYCMTVDLGYSVPLEQLDLEEYSASIYINDRYFGDITLTGNETSDLYQFNIPETYIRDGTNTVSIKCEELWSPTDYGSQDTRNLGLCIERIIFKPAE